VLKSFSPTNSSYSVTANPSYSGSPKPMFSQLQVETYTGLTPQLNALRTGSLDIASLDFSQLGEVGALRSDGYSVFGYPVFGWYGAFFNFKDTTGHFNSIVSQLYVRQALAELEDQPAYLSGIYKDAGVLDYGPVPSVPPSPYAPPDAVKPPYPYNPAAAVALLRAHGWHVVPNGTTTCAKAGAGPGECGAGIPAGTPLAFTWFYIPPSATPSISLESEALASEAKQAAGINIQLESKTLNFLIANYNDANPSDMKYTNDWGVLNFGGDSEGYYPTTKGIFDTGGNFNQGAYSNPTADKLINDSVYGSNTNAVTAEAAFLTQNLPVLFFPNGDDIIAVSHRVSGTPSSWIALAENQAYPQYWYLAK
jgi:peptide/nickel transport system substrate-binding protein